MEFETVVLENNDTQVINLGDAQQAYQEYPQAAALFQAKLVRYQTIVNEMKSRPPASISGHEMRRVDAAAEEADLACRECREMRSILHRRIEELHVQGVESENALLYHSLSSGEEQTVEWGRSMLHEALLQKDNGDLLAAAEKAYQARECLFVLLAKANQEWMQRHQFRSASMGSD